jgi:hypothetical protein
MGWDFCKKNTQVFKTKNSFDGLVDYGGDGMIINKSEKLADHACVDFSMLQI